MLIAMPPGQIVLFKSIVESYDNLATLRTEDPVRHHLRIYFSADSREEVEAGIAPGGDYPVFEITLDDWEQDFSIPGPYGH